MAHARHAFGLAVRQSDGAPWRAHLEARARGRDAGAEQARADLVPPPCPQRYAYLFDWFGELHRQRTYTEHGPTPLGWMDLDAWMRVTQRTPSPWEIRMLSALDDAFFAAQHGTSDEKPVSKTVDRAWPAPKVSA